MVMRAGRPYVAKFKMCEFLTRAESQFCVAKELRALLICCRLSNSQSRKLWDTLYWEGIARIADRLETPPRT
jgi:hypothetical protein